MGSTCSRCAAEKAYLNLKQPVRLNQRWIQAVNEGNVVACKFMHLEDPDVIDQIVDPIKQEHAIHVATRNKYVMLLKYLLENQSDVDHQSTNGNTALHEACINNDVTVIKLLIQYGANIKIRNKSNKLSKDLCNIKVKREFTKAKVEKLRKMGPKSSNLTANTTNDTRDIFINSQCINDINPKERRDHGQSTPRETKTVKNQEQRKDEIDSRNRAGLFITNFGKNVGCEIDEIGIFVERLNNKDVFWNKILKENVSSITRRKDLHKLMLALTLATLKQKRTSERPFHKTLDDGLIKEFVSKVRDKLPKQENRLKFVLSKDQFVSNFHVFLYQIHDQWPKL